MNRALPSLLVVPGAWHTPAHFAPLLAELAGLNTHTVALPSTGDDPAQLGDMYADAAAIKAAVAGIDGPTVVLAHSYGGIPTTQALGGMRNVRRIIYLAAFQLDVGGSLFCVGGGAPMAWSTRRHHAAGDHLNVADPVDVFYRDVDAATARWAVGLLGHLSYAAGRQPLTEAAWKTVPSTYIVCEADNALPPAVQERFARRADDVRRIDSSHSPFLSRPAELARLVENVLSDYTSGV